MQFWTHPTPLRLHFNSIFFFIILDGPIFIQTQHIFVFFFNWNSLRIFGHHFLYRIELFWWIFKTAQFISNHFIDMEFHSTFFVALEKISTNFVYLGIKSNNCFHFWKIYFIILFHKHTNSRSNWKLTPVFPKLVRFHVFSVVN